MKRIDEYPYILDEWNKLVQEAPELKSVYDGMVTHGRRRGEVDEESSRIYAWLKNKGIGREDFVMILMPRSYMVVSAVLGVIKAGAAFVIVDSHYSPERLNYIYQDCNCKLKIDLDTWQEAMAEEPMAGYETTDPHDACFAVYTSGSTGNPKGIIHEYGKLKLMQMTAIRPYVDQWKAGGCKFALIPPLNFVAALKFIVHGIYTGMRIFIVPTDVIKNPGKLKQYFLDYKITDAHLAPSVIRAAGNSFGPYLKRVITGSEPPNGIDFPDACLINNYTMSESAFVVAQYTIEKKEEAVPIGKPNFEEIRIHLLDEEGNEVKDGEAGEICFENPYFRKYNNLPQATEEAFRGGLFHTGDLGRKREDGNYIIVGRMNDMIKINGNRVEPAEIERQAKKILGIDWCVAKGFVDEDKAFLCLYYTDDIEFDVIEVKEKFGAVLPYYMVPTYFVRLDEVPLLPNNKINKKALPKPDTSSYRTEYVKPRNELEARICEGMEKALGIDRVGIRDDFFELGGDSLSAMALLAYLDWEQMSSDFIYAGITAERIAALYMKRISSASVMTPEEFEMEARKHPHALTDIQIYMLDMTLHGAKKNTLNMFGLYKINDKKNIVRVKDALNEAIRNTPICSTVVFFDDDCEIRQRYEPEICPVVEIEHTTEAEFEEIRKVLVVHTDVINKNLYSFRLFETEKCGYILINRHHIGTDGMAKRLFYRRIVDAYQGKELPLDTYYSYLERRREYLTEGYIKACRKYYMDHYGGIDWTYDIRHDRNLKDRSNEFYPYPINVTQKEMEDFEARTGITRNQIFNIVLLMSIAKSTGSNDVLMTYSYHNRSDQVSSEAVGAIYKGLPLGLRLDHYRNLAELVNDVRDQSTGNIQHCNYNWFDIVMPETIMESSSITYETKEIMDSEKIFEEIGMEKQEISSSEPQLFPGNIMGMVLDTDEGFNVVFVYQNHLYEKETIGRFAVCFDSLMKVMTGVENLSEITIDYIMDQAKA